MPEHVSFEDADLVRFHLKRSAPDPTEVERVTSDPVLAVGQFVSMPYLVGADEHAHKRYQQDRLFTVKRITCGTVAVIDVSGTELHLTPAETLLLCKAGEEIAVRLVQFTTRSALRAANPG